MSEMNNVISSRRNRGENIIKLPPESYAEVSIRSVDKIRRYAKSAKNDKNKLRSILLSIWTACLGAILGYFPDAYSIIVNQSPDSSGKISTVYIIVFCIGLLCFAFWRHMEEKSGKATADLITAIEEELSEERIPINQTSFSKGIDSKAKFLENSEVNDYSYSVAKES